MTGGFTGQPDTREYDVDQLPEPLQKRVRELVGPQFWALPEVQRKAAPKPWDFEYKVTVEDGDKSRTVRVHKDAADPNVRKLIEMAEEELP